MGCDKDTKVHSCMSVSIPISFNMKYPADINMINNMCQFFILKKLVLFNINLIETACFHMKTLEKN